MKLELSGLEVDCVSAKRTAGNISIRARATVNDGARFGDVRRGVANNPVIPGPGIDIVNACPGVDRVVTSPCFEGNAK